MLVTVLNYTFDPEKPKPVSFILNGDRTFSLMILCCQSGLKPANVLKINKDDLVDHTSRGI